MTAAAPKERTDYVALRIDILTLFPDIFFGPLDSSIVGRARKKGLVEINTVNLRNFTHDRHQTVDDTPFGGGPGMLMKADVLSEAVLSLRKPETLVILTGPRGDLFTQKDARALAKKKNILFICGHYEGVDERIRTNLIDREYSIGDYILTSGNLPAMVMTDAIVRLLPGALGDGESAEAESFENGLLEYPQYTRPVEFNGVRVPDVLLSGDHERIAKWRRAESVRITLEKRPGLIAGTPGKQD